MKSAYLVAAMLLVLAGCSSKTTQSGMLNSFVPQAQAEPSVIQALNGGIIDPSVSASLSAGDRRLALEAEYRALEVAPVGQIVAWKSSKSGAFGEVHAAQPYEVGSQNCRQYIHKVEYEGQSKTTRGTACREQNGRWTPLV